MSGFENMGDLKEAVEEVQRAAGAEDPNDDPDFQLTQEQALQLLEQAGGQAGLAAALQGKLGHMIGSTSGFIEAMPKKVRNRVKTLQDMQKEHDELEEEYKKERAALEAKYDALYDPLYKKRTAIVTGAEEAPEREDEEEEDDEEEEEAEAAEEVKGIPDFWLCVLRNHEVTEEQISEKDAEALKFLQDITSDVLDGEDENGFKLTFFFDTNPFFENTVLTKTYYMVDDDDPILERAEGTEIQWKAGKNLTVKIMKKKPKKGGRGSGKPLTKTEPCESFFNFFSPPKIPEDDEEIEEEEMEQLQEVMEADYEIGSAIKERLIPHAISWFTGEAVDMDMDDDEDDDEDDDDEDDDDDEAGGIPKGLQDTGEKPPECKQQ